MRIITQIFLLLFLISAASFAADIRLPEPLVYKEMCPSGCCSNKQRVVTKLVLIHSAPDEGSEIVATLKPGNIVECLTGEVHYKPIRFIVKKPFGKYHSKEIIWVYQYLEEGIFTVQYNGQVYEEDLGFDPNDPSVGKRCELSDLCLGSLENEIVPTLWVEVKGKHGWRGWTDEVKHLQKIGSNN